MELAERANRLTGGMNPLVLRTLAAAYAGNNRFDKALATSSRALQFAQEQGNPEVAQAVRRDMAFYENGQPYRAD